MPDFKQTYGKYVDRCRQRGVLPQPEQVFEPFWVDVVCQPPDYIFEKLPHARDSSVETRGVVLTAQGYELLAEVFARAFDQAANGKGKERHADDKPFHEQPMQLIADKRGIGFILGQADKKSEEAQGMLNRGQKEACVKELLGSIVYLAGAVIFVEKNL